MKRLVNEPTNRGKGCLFKIADVGETRIRGVGHRHQDAQLVFSVAYANGEHDRQMVWKSHYGGFVPVKA